MPPKTKSSTSIGNNKEVSGESSTSSSRKGATGMRGVKRTNSDMMQSTLGFSSKPKQQTLPPTPKKTPGTVKTSSSTSVIDILSSPVGPRAEIEEGVAAADDNEEEGEETGLMSPPATQPSPTKKSRIGSGGMLSSAPGVAERDETNDEEEHRDEGEEEDEEEQKMIMLSRATIGVEYKPLAPLGKEPKAMLDNLGLKSYPESEEEGNKETAPVEELAESEEEDENEIQDEIITTPKSIYDAHSGTAVRRSMLAIQDQLENVRKLSATSINAAASSSSTKSRSKPKSNPKAKGKATPITLDLEAEDEDTDSVGKHLNPKDKKWEGVYMDAFERMGAKEVAPIHCTPKSHTKIHHILRVFDLSPEYGPAIGISRLQRWQRAEEWGLNPPAEIKDILLTLEGAEETSYRENVFYGTGIYATSA